jgi:hypothetical protein
MKIEKKKKIIKNLLQRLKYTKKKIKFYEKNI